jgi:hypothetical protein
VVEWTARASGVRVSGVAIAYFGSGFLIKNARLIWDAPVPDDASPDLPTGDGAAPPIRSDEPPPPPPPQLVAAVSNGNSPMAPARAPAAASAHALSRPAPGSGRYGTRSRKRAFPGGAAEEERSTGSGPRDVSDDSSMSSKGSGE